MPSLPQSSTEGHFNLQQPAPRADRERWGVELASYNLEKVVSDLLSHLDTHKCMGLNGIHQRILRELAEGLAKPFSVIIVSPDKLGRFQTTGG